MGKEPLRAGGQAEGSEFMKEALPRGENGHRINAAVERAAPASLLAYSSVHCRPASFGNGERKVLARGAGMAFGLESELGSCRLVVAGHNKLFCRGS